uniref:glutamine--fructose-6-phosphate transaminase (isomerizing) n=1 Tax=Agathobacter sp. TaxID=2021311 RepID=UPI004056F785
MCGIVGYIGTRQAAPILLDGLSKLEYRGYDSAGISIRSSKQNRIDTVKAKGRLKILAEKTDDGKALKGTSGIGHTRWATHGEPSELNAHPHCSDDCNVMIVHNGIIENYMELKEKLVKAGYQFYSQTDTEVAAKLIDYYDKKLGGEHLEALARAMLRIRGSYALGIMFADCPEKVYAVRKDSPLIVGQSADGMYIASDVPAILKHTKQVYYIGNMEIAVLEKDAIHFFNVDLEEIKKEIVNIKWDAEVAEKGGFEHFMMKEIYEQPKAVSDTLNYYLKDGKISLTETGLKEETLKQLERIYIVACGSAYHVGMVGKYVIEELTGIPVEVDFASEFRYRNPRIIKNALVVIISQSGETADSLATLRLAKETGVPTLGIVNVLGSSIAREADFVMYTYAGPEISVATTKAYSAQLITIYLLAMQLATEKGLLADKEKEELIKELEALPDKINKILEDKERIQWFATKYANAKSIFFIGRGIDYGICMEGSLKLKEISYIHSEAYAAGELKHGTISLIEDGTLVIGVLTRGELFEKSISNMLEVKSRGAYLMGVTTYGNYNIEETADFSVYVPKTAKYFTTSLGIVPLQLLAYYVSVAKGLDVDKPRNLAKSVTVE